YYQIEISLEDQEKTTFTCPFGTFTFRKMPFGLCNAPATFQRCMISIFSDMVEKYLEVFMDDITVFGFYWRFIQNFSAIARPLNNLLEKDAKFDWNYACQEAFEKLIKMLTSTPVMQPPNSSMPFEIMCDASDGAIGAVLGQRKDKKPVVICYAIKTLNSAQKIYTTTEKELLAV
ncbi:PREDICTED: LOW QUALITY PROTEIN, partial [Prunus dulcis]